jgi:hypothetical protein
MFESVFEMGQTDPWQNHYRIPSQYQTGTCPQIAAAAPQSSPASANPMVHCYCHILSCINGVLGKIGGFLVRF